RLSAADGAAPCSPPRRRAWAVLAGRRRRVDPGASAWPHDSRRSVVGPHDDGAVGAGIPRRHDLLEGGDVKIVVVSDVSPVLLLAGAERVLRVVTSRLDAGDRVGRGVGRTPDGA